MITKVDEASPAEVASARTEVERLNQAAPVHLLDACDAQSVGAFAQALIGAD